ncbi:hypothetical protein TYRP_021705 [Tyrophagus putrescentiae]|nr:hypothetical protein TYRP_021705 [Tyrophagus putrescentiae]
MKLVTFYQVKYSFRHSVSLFRQVTFPYKNLNYYRQFFITSQKITNILNGSEQDDGLVFFFKLYLIFLVYLAVLYIFFYLFPVSDFTRLLLSDTVFILLKDNQFYLLYLGIVSYTVFLFWSLYIYQAHNKLKMILAIAFFEDNNKIVWKILTRQWALIVINSLQVFILQINVCFLFFAPLNIWTFLNSNIELINTIDKNSETLQPFYLTKNVLLAEFPLLICIHLFHLFLVFTTWYAFAHTLILIASYGTCCFVYAFLRFKQNYQTLKKAFSRTLNSVSRADKNISKVTRLLLGHVATTLESNSTNFCFVFHFDRFIGSQLVIYLSSHMPISALFVTEILVRRDRKYKAISQPPVTQLVKLGLVLEALVGSLLLHLIMAKFSSHIHKAGIC